jgi:hypothetical protein
MGADLSSPRRAEIDAFLKKQRLRVQAAPSGRGRLMISLDATASRQATWDLACSLMADVFEEVARIGGLDVALTYYRGHKEFTAEKWVSDARTLIRMMNKVDCRAGHTQIARVLSHARKESAQLKVQALVFIGDAIEETPADLYAVARDLGMRAFMFQEGDDPDATKVFREIARLTRGAYHPFNSGSAKQLGELLRVAAAYAAGGPTALNRSTSGAAVKLLEQLKR